MVARATALLLAALACTGLAHADVSPSELRQGGYVLYMRHASTDFGQNDARMRSGFAVVGRIRLEDRQALQ